MGKPHVRLPAINAARSAPAEERRIDLRSSKHRFSYVYEKHQEGMVEVHRVLLGVKSHTPTAWGAQRQKATGVLSSTSSLLLAALALVAATTYAGVAEWEKARQALTTWRLTEGSLWLLHWHVWGPLGLLVAFVLLALLVDQSRVIEEAVIVILGTGIQLERVFRSGYVERRLVPLERIQWAFINEYVGVHSCHFYLALLQRGGASDRLTLVFQTMRPPLALLVPILNSMLRALHD